MLAWLGLVATVLSLEGGARAAGPASAPAAASAPRVKAHVMIVDFAGEDAELGKAVAQSVRMRLARHAEYFVLDRISTQDLSPALGAEGDANAAIGLLNRAGCDVAFWGTVRKSGGSVTADVRCASLSDAAGAAGWRKQFTDTTERAGPLIATGIVEALTGQPEWVPPQYGDEAEPKDFGKPINVSGDFEKGATGWQSPDNVASFLEAAVDAASSRVAKRPEAPSTEVGKRLEAASIHGTILRIRTDLARDPWLEYYRNLRLGLADANRPPKIATDTSYGSVAGLEGVHFNSDWLPAEAGRRYWLAADVKKPGGTPKVFVKGFTDWSASADGLPELSMVERKLTPQAFAAMEPNGRKALIAEDARAHGDRYRREVYRWYLNCREGGKDWTHQAAPFPPRGGLPANVQWLQIQVYAYWPPGTYYFDNVHLYTDPRQKAPVAEEPGRTPGRPGALPPN